MRFALTVVAVVALGACRDPATALSTCDPVVTPLRGPMLEIKFVETLLARACGPDRLRSDVGADLLELEALLTRLSVKQIQPLFDAAAVARLVEEARKLGNEVTVDLLSWHRLVFANDADRDAALDVLSARAEVEYVYAVDTIPPPPPGPPEV